MPIRRGLYGDAPTGDVLNPTAPVVAPPSALAAPVLAPSPLALSPSLAPPIRVPLGGSPTIRPTAAAIPPSAMAGPVNDTPLVLPPATGPVAPPPIAPTAAAPSTSTWNNKYPPDENGQLPYIQDAAGNIIPNPKYHPPAGAPPVGGTSGPPDYGQQAPGTKPKTPPAGDLQAKAPPSSYASPPPSPDVSQKVSDYISSHNLKADQSNPQALFDIVQYLRSQGVNAQVDYTDENGHTGGILVDGHPYQLIDGSNNWTALQPWQESRGGGTPTTPTGGLPNFGLGGGSDYSSALNDALLKMSQSGMTPMGGDISNVLMNIIRGGGAPDLTRQLVGAREAEAAGMRGQLSDVRGALADRGTVSEPGVSQGPEPLAIQRTAEALAPTYGQAIGDIETHGMDIANQNVQQALSLATGMSQDQAQNILSAIGTGTNRQLGLAQIALQSLQGDRDWQKFLAQYGLDETRILEELRQGRTAQLIELLRIYEGQTQTAAQGTY